MTFLSINPDCEPYSRKSAAAALFSVPSNRADILCSFDKKVTPVLLAKAYKNAESLGLDLYSLKKCPCTTQMTTPGSGRVITSQVKRKPAPKI